MGTALTDAELEVLWRAGAPLWPSVALGLEDFVAWARQHLAADVPRDKLAPADLYLVAACVSQAPGAARAFVEGPLAETDPSIKRHLPDPEARTEVMHELGAYLLTPGPNEPDVPRLASFAGRGPLRAWLRMAAARRALKRIEAQARFVSYDEVVADSASDVDPELSLLRRKHKTDINAIFKEAIGVLSAEERTLIRLHYGEGTSLGDLAALYRTSRSSLHRKVESARDVLFETIAALVKQRLRLSVSQQGSLLAIFRSDLRDALGRMIQEG